MMKNLNLKQLFLLILALTIYSIFIIWVYSYVNTLSQQGAENSDVNSTEQVNTTDSSNLYNDEQINEDLSYASQSAPSLNELVYIAGGLGDTKKQDFDLKVISVEMPKEIQVNSATRIKVTLQNTGNKEWSDQNLVKLYQLTKDLRLFPNSQNDNDLYISLFAYGQNIKIQPNQTITIYPIIYASSAGDKTFMLQGVKYNQLANRYDKIGSPSSSYNIKVMQNINSATTDGTAASFVEYKILEQPKVNTYYGINSQYNFITTYIKNKINGKFTISVKYKNTGTVAWDSSNFSLGTQAPAANSLFGLDEGSKVSLSKGEIIKPGETKEFKFKVNVNPAIFIRVGQVTSGWQGVYFLQFRMQKGTTFFGEYSKPLAVYWTP